MFIIYRIYIMRAPLIIIICLTLGMIFYPGIFQGKEREVKEDIISKSKKGDLLTSPPKTKAIGGKSASDKIKTTSAAPSASDSGAGNPTAADNPKPDRDYLDVYIGKCPFTTEAINTAKRFHSRRSNYHIQYYGMKTISDFAPKASDMEGIEIYLPVDAKKYDITTVPAFILNTKGTTYKVSGAADLDEIYEEIEKGKARGEKKRGYIDLGERGEGCRAVIVDLRPEALTPQQVRQVNTESRPPDMRNLINKERISLPESSKTVYLTRQANTPFVQSKFIVFSESQAEWAMKEIRSGAYGCCTDCVRLDKFWPNAQYCTAGLLKDLGVNSVPTVVTFKSGKTGESAP